MTPSLESKFPIRLIQKADCRKNRQKYVCVNPECEGVVKIDVYVGQYWSFASDPEHHLLI